MSKKRILQKQRAGEVSYHDIGSGSFELALDKIYLIRYI